MVEERRLAVLRAVVEDYVRTQEPVGSKTLAEQHNLGVSPATLRNDMALLEEEGYLASPHTSAGRVPTDKGYRLFVDRLSTVKALSAAEQRAIRAFLDGAVDLDDVVGRTVRLLAQLTRQAALVQYPSLSRSAVRHVELVALSPGRVMLVLITTTGRVEQRVVEVPERPEATPLPDLLVDLRARLNAALVGQLLPEAPAKLGELCEAYPVTERAAVGGVLAVLLETLVESQEERVVLAGTANLARLGPDFPLTIQPVLEALEEHVVLLRLLGEADDATMTVRIGSENPHEGLAGTSVVAAGYGPGTGSGSGEASVVAKLAVLGPTRMDYPLTMGAVRAVARYVSRILAEA